MYYLFTKGSDVIAATFESNGDFLIYDGEVQIIIEKAKVNKRPAFELIKMMMDKYGYKMETRVSES